MTDPLDAAEVADRLAEEHQASVLIFIITETEQVYDLNVHVAGDLTLGQMNKVAITSLHVCRDNLLTLMRSATHPQIEKALERVVKALVVMGDDESPPKVVHSKPSTH